VLKLLPIALVVVPFTAIGQAITVHPHPSGAGVEVVHSGPHPVIALKIGERGLLSLFPGDRLHLDAAPDSDVSGRFPLGGWAAALGTLGAPWAEYHLRTAGAYLDALEPGRDGAPSEASNLAALRDVEPAVFAQWVETPPLRLALVARAARHAPVALLSAVLAATSPESIHAPWPEAYAILDTLPALVRDAIEAKGAKAVPALISSPAWAADRGLGDPVLAWAFRGQRTAVRAALAARTDPAASKALEVIETKLEDDFAQRLASAMEADRIEEALHLATHAAARWTMDESTTPSADAARLTCATLDGASVTAIRKNRLLAAEAYLRLAGAACGDRQIYRERIADLFGAIGEESVGRGDFGDAVQWFHGAHYFGKRAIDRARLADTLAEISLLRFREGEILEGSTHLDAAQDIDPLRPRVVEAVGVRPKADPRAKLGIFIIIVFLGLFAIRRLRKVWSLGGNGGGRLKRRR